MLFSERARQIDAELRELMSVQFGSVGTRCCRRCFGNGRVRRWRLPALYCWSMTTQMSVRSQHT